MTNNDKPTGLSPTVIMVIDQCISALRTDAEVDGAATDRLEKLLHSNAVPKPEDIDAALFPVAEDKI